ncbi:MAG: rhodanese-like domain-containing protein [Jatrophihabitantaceae bacterium]
MNPQQIPTITLDDLPQDATVLDVREPHEWQAGHIDGALHVPMNSVPAAVTNQPELIPAERRVYVVCGMGGRSGQVTAWLVQRGYDAVNLAGGMHAWESAGRPMRSENGQPPVVV